VHHIGEGVLPDEKKVIMLAVVLEDDKKAETFFTAKGAASDLLEKIGVVDFSFDADGVFPELWHPGRRAQIVVNGKRIGCVGELSPMVLANYKIGKRVAMVKFELESLMKNVSERQFVSLRKYPTVVRDVSMMASRKITVAEIMKNIQTSGEEMVLGVELFDVFQKEEKNSFAYHIELGADDRTLESADVDEAMEKIVSNLEKELGVEIRK
jgi:phenylalanyl-tRNA synthetase beta chain